MSDALTEEFGEPESAIMIAVVDKAVHIAYSKDLSGQPEEILDILETAAMMVMSSMQEVSGEKIH